MSLKTNYKEESMLRSIPLPNHGGRYAVIPHGDVIDETRNQLQAAGFEIENELYRSSTDGQIAQGTYHLKYGNDPDMGLMFAWSNSYNKQIRFKCASGARVFICMNGVVSGDMSNFKRKHVGKSAMSDVINSIQEQIAEAGVHFNTLVSDKEMLKNVILTPRDKGHILGELFANDEILTLTQVGIVKREIYKPTYTYNCDINSAWSMYNYITLALKESHPRTYIEDHQRVHQYFVDRYGNLVTAQPVPEEIIYEVEVEEVMSDSDFGVNFL